MNRKPPLTRRAGATRRGPTNKKDPRSPRVFVRPKEEKDEPYATFCFTTFSTGL